MNIDMNTKCNMLNIDQLRKALQRTTKVKVGILAETNNRDNSYLDERVEKLKNDKKVPKSILNKMKKTSKKNPSNADVGAAAEFGVISSGIPARPWLLPSTKKTIKKLNDKKEEILTSLISEGNQKKALNLIGETAVNTVEEMFNSRGDGTWTPNSELTTYIKESNQPLIDTTQLKNSISYKVQE